MATGSHRKVPSRASMPRRTTRGPLDKDDDLLPADLSPMSPISAVNSTPGTPPAKSQDLNPFDKTDHPENPPLSSDLAERIHVDDEKNLSFLLDASIYHPLSQVDILPPFRKPLPPPPQAGTTIRQALTQLDSLVAKCDFMSAAHYAAICLTCGIIQPSDYTTIFRLLAIRYSCLEMIGQLLLAAQEAKALEDLSSEFYYVVPQVTEANIEVHGGQRPLVKHIMPFDLRVQAMRLQNIGFSDPRRGVTALYDLGLEAREHIGSPYTSEPERAEWSKRLESLSMHVVNALIELGDVDCAQRTLAQSRPKDAKAHTWWIERQVLMLVKLGQLSKAQVYINELESEDSATILLSSVVSMADGRLDEAVTYLERLTRRQHDPALTAIATQNLAVAYLYLGRIQDASKLLEGLVEAGDSVQSLTINLATIYDLTSDKSRDLKMGLVNRVASSNKRTRAFTNADFKL